MYYSPNIKAKIYESEFYESKLAFNVVSQGTVLSFWFKSGKWNLERTGRNFSDSVRVSL